MTTTPGWDPRSGLVGGGGSAGPAPRGTGGWPPDDAGQRRQGARGAGPAAGRRWVHGAAGESYEPGEPSGPRGAQPPGNGFGPGRPGSAGADSGSLGSAGPAPVSGASGRSGPGFTPNRAAGPRGGTPAGSPTRVSADGDSPARPRPATPRSTSSRLTGGRPAAPSRRPSTAGQATGDVLVSSGALTSAPLLHWIGRMRTGVALLVLAGATVIGLLLTLLAGREPGVLLGVFIIAGSLAAVLGVRRTAVYVLFPLPAIAFFCAAMASGIVHDSELASSTAGLGVTFVQWVGGIFLPMVVATVLVVVIGGSRWVFGSQLVTRHAPPAERTGGRGRPGASSRRPADRDSWAAEDPFDGTGPQRGQAGPASRPDGSGVSSRRGPGGRTARQSGEQRADRDPWGDPRLPADRSQPPRGQAPRTQSARAQSRRNPPPGAPADRSQPPADRSQPPGAPAEPTRPSGTRAPRPAPRPPGASARPADPAPPPPGPSARPADPASPPQPRDRTSRPQSGSRSGPSWNPAARPVSRPRPPRPPEGWNPR